LKKRSIGIDLGSHSIKAVAGEFQGPLFCLRRAVQVPLEGTGGGEEAILAGVARLREVLGPAPGARFGISGRDLIIRYTQVPPVPTWRLRLLMDFEVREMSEQAGEALAADYNLLGLRHGESDTLLVAVVKEPFLQAREAALAAAVGPPRAATPASIALFNAYLQAGELHEGEYVAVADIGEANTEIIIQKDGELFFARNLPVGGGVFTDALRDALRLAPVDAARTKEELGNVTPRGLAAYTSGREERVANALLGPAGQLASMLQSTIAFSRAQTGVKDLSLGRLLLSGGGAALRGLPDYLAQNLRCPVERFQPANGLDLSGLPAVEALEFEADPGRFAVALGLAVTGTRPESFQIDVVPEATRRRREFRRRTVWMYAAAAAAVVVLAWQGLDLKRRVDAAAVEASRYRVRAAESRRRSEEFTALRNRVISLNEKQAALAALTEPSLTLGRVPRLLQEHWREGVWIEQIDVRRMMVPVVAGDPKQGRVAQTQAKVGGEVLGVDVQASSVLEEMALAIQGSEGRPQVQLVRTGGGEAVGSKKLAFEAVINLFAAPAGSPPAPGGN
jgi:type IV pilus assembly protein PilM